MKKYTAPTKRNIEGIIKITGKGIGYIDLPDSETSIEIETSGLNTALPGDTVEVLVHPEMGRNGIRGEVVRIVLRARTRFVGTLEKEGPTGPFFLVPNDRRIYTDILIVDTPPEKLQAGHKALITMREWKDPRKSPEGVVEEILGVKGEHETEISSILHENGIVYDFPTEVEAEAKAHATNFEKTVEQELKTRRDFRNITTFTIDPVDAKDFDDALSVEYKDDGTIEIGVHIADVSQFVVPGTALDTEARRRATSVYLVDRTIPMLPEILSGDLCSLKPDVPRLTFSAVFGLDKEGHVKSEWFGRTVIHSNKRFTYEEAQGVLDTGSGPFHKELHDLNTLAKKMRARRIAAGSVLFDQEEVKIKLDENKKAIGVEVKPVLDTNLLIEEYMLLANKYVAHFLGEKKGAKGVVYRIHDVPDRERMEMLSVFLKSLGYDLKTEAGAVRAQDLNALFAQIKGTAEEVLIQTAALRSMAKAIYSTKNIGHFGLGFEYYVHFTSPIRRYPDVLIHRILAQVLAGGTPASHEVAEYESLSLYSSERENEAARAERASIRFKQVEYLAPKVGEIFDGTISGITEWGIYITEKLSRTEGMIRLGALSEDFYEFDQKQFALVGKRTKKKYRLGDVVKVKLTAVDTEARTVDFAFV